MSRITSSSIKTNNQETKIPWLDILHERNESIFLLLIWFALAFYTRLHPAVLT